MSEAEQQRLEGQTVGMLVASEGTEDVEFTESRDALEDAGADVEVLAPEDGEAQTVENDLEEGETYEVDRPVDDATPSEYDALVVPGGTVGADNLRAEDDVVDLIEAHVDDGKPVGSICHGPWALVEADVVDGRRLTSYPSLETDVRNAGGEWVDEELVRDAGIVTSRNPDDLDAFCEGIVDAFATEAE